MIDSVKTLEAGLTSELRLYCQSFIVYINILKNLNFLTSFEHHTFSPFRIAVVDCQQRKLLDLFTIALKFYP